MKKPELLMPAGDLEKARIAYQFGADACYGSTSAFSMRTREIGFDYKTLKEAIDYAHSIGKKFYVTLNTYPHEFELSKIRSHTKKLITMRPDAVIVADAGILQIVREQITRYKKQDTNKFQNSNLKSQNYGRPHLPKVSGIGDVPFSGPQDNKAIEIHLSTQANATNSEAIKFWASQGVSRIILPRELALREIAEIRKRVPKKIMLEAFVHGAMCNSVSGRCNLSNYLSYRDANRGACVQPCRWKYALVEEKRPGQYIPIGEDEEGSYIYNSRDLCMIEHLDELREAGVGSFKVEGRNKSIFYAAIVARAYRKAIDSLSPVIARRDDEAISGNNKIATPKGLAMTNIEGFENFKRELETVTSRGYSTGFYFGKPTDADINYETSRPSSDWQFVGIVKEASNYKLTANSYLVEVRNEIKKNTKIEIVTPVEVYSMTLKELVTPEGEKLPKANPNDLIVLESNKNLAINSVIRSRQ